MANGQFHGKRKTGIKITNPLTLPVSVKINCPTGALHTGDGKDTWRTIRPGETLSIPTKGRTEVDIDVHIIRYDELGNQKKVGDGGWQPISTIATKSKTPVKAGPVILMDRGDVSNGRWRIIKMWRIPLGFAGLLGDISIQITGDAEARVELPGEAPYKARKDATLNYQNNRLLQADQAVKVKGRSRNGKGGTVEVMIRGELYPAGTRVPVDIRPGKPPEPITEKKKRIEPEEPTLRSLGDMIAEMRKEEEAVKV